MRRKIIILLILFASVYYLYRYFNDSPAKELAEFIQSAATLASYEYGEHPFQKISWAKELASQCLQPCKITLVFEDATENFSLTRDDIVKYLGALRLEVEQLAVTALNPKIKSDWESGEMKVLLRGMGRSRGRDDYFFEEHEVLFKFKKVEGEWKIESVINVSPIANNPVNSP